jgi:HEAT repeat protein/tetratricopeptide (TPR) repeat protein
MLSNAPLSSLDRVVSKYRSDVHHLPGGAPEEALTALQEHLGFSLPAGLNVFLSRHNGAHLFRGAMRIRSCSEMAIASAQCPRVVLFADGGEDGVTWAWARGREGGVVFGQWTGEELCGFHTSFGGWLAGVISVLETGVSREKDRVSIRMEADPSDPYQLLQAGVRALTEGQPERAQDYFVQVTQKMPGQVEAWQRLGDALALSSPNEARKAWLKSFQHAQLPLDWPGASCFDPEVLPRLAKHFLDSEDWERELRSFLKDRVADARTEREADLVVSVGMELSRTLLGRGQRSQARDVLTDLLSKCRVFEWAHTPWRSVLKLVAMEIDLGHHDEAEALIRRVLAEGPGEIHGAALLALGRIAMTRQEPWAEEILGEAVTKGLALNEQVRCRIIRVERAIRCNEPVHLLGEAVTDARRLAAKLGQPQLQAQVLLLEGDIARIGKRLEESREHYNAALGLLKGRTDTELRFRLVSRKGDLALSHGRRKEAFDCFREAADGFRRFELPVREGWALVRLARVSEQRLPLLRRARERFCEADIAAGVAAVDAVSGEPGASLAWHLDRATSHARARHNAQRSRPPWGRSDADRPERRIGAHRLAIAACSEKIVEAIAAEMLACTRAMDSGRSRDADPPVLRYIAAVDLLSGHRSYMAAQVLLDHLVEQRVDGPARRALQGAMCRSRNAALVDGLLSCIEQPGKFTGPAVAAAAELLGMRREKVALDALKSLVSRESSPLTRKVAITALGRIGDRRMADVLLDSLEEPSLAEPAALALLMLGDRRGVDFHGRALAENRLDLQGHPAEIVGRYGGPSHLLLLIRLAEGEDERALGALQGLGLMGDARAVPILLKALSARRRKIVEVASGALQILTGHCEDVDNPGFKARWHVWWEANHENFQDGVRYRDGEHFGASLLLRRMKSDDPWTRRTAYDELVITTGCSLPFDSDGPWRTQRGHLRAWFTWWNSNRESYQAGRWYLDGKSIG